MIIDVAAADDFYRVVRPAYLDLLEGQDPGPATLEVVLAPGTYETVHLTLSGGAGSGAQDGAARRCVTVILRGADPTRPPVLSDLTVILSAHDVTLRDIVFWRGVVGLPLLRADVEGALLIERCAFLDNALTGQPGSTLFAFESTDEAGATTATLRRCLFVRNHTPAETALLSFASPPPRRFARVACEEVAFVDNTTPILLAPHTAADLHLSDCLCYAPAPDATDGEAAGSPEEQGDGDGEAPILVALTWPGTALTIARSTLVCRDLTTLAVRFAHAGQEAEGTPALVAYSDLYLHHLPPEGAAAAPAGLLLRESALYPSTALETGADLDARLGAWSAWARQGRPPDQAALRAGLGLPPVPALR